MYQNIDEMKQDLNKFLIFYNFNRGHGGLRKEIKVRTPYEALEYWFSYWQRGGDERKIWRYNATNSNRFKQ
jgi:hypothetical protein